MADEQNPAFLVDGIKSIAIHNDTVRIQFMQLDNEGRPTDTVRILVPLKQIPPIQEGLKNIRPGR